MPLNGNVKRLVTHEKDRDARKDGLHRKGQVTQEGLWRKRICDARKRWWQKKGCHTQENTGDAREDSDAGWRKKEWVTKTGWGHRKKLWREKMGDLGKDSVTRERTGDALKDENEITWGPCSQHFIFFITNLWASKLEYLSLASLPCLE